MLLTFKVVLMIFTLLFGLGAIGERDKDKQKTNGLVFMFTITALVTTFVIQ